VLARPSDECPIIIEAGDLKKTSPLRALIENQNPPRRCPAMSITARRSANSSTMRCARRNLTIAPDARANSGVAAWRRPHGVAQRNPQTGALDRGEARVELADVIAVWRMPRRWRSIGVIDAAFAGRPPRSKPSSQSARRRLVAAGDHTRRRSAGRHLHKMNSPSMTAIRSKSP